MIYPHFPRYQQSRYGSGHLLLILLMAMLAFAVLKQSKPVTLSARHTAAICGRVICHMDCKTCKKCLSGLPCAVCLHQ